MIFRFSGCVTIVTRKPKLSVSSFNECYYSNITTQTCESVGGLNLCYHSNIDSKRRGPFYDLSVTIVTSEPEERDEN